VSIQFRRSRILYTCMLILREEKNELAVTEMQSSSKRKEVPLL
jgi:hypothetical protein